MRTTLAVLGLAGALGLVYCQSAAALPFNAGTIRQSPVAASALEPAQYAEHHGRYGVVKCYRELVFGRYVCHTFPY